MAKRCACIGIVLLVGVAAYLALRRGAPATSHLPATNPIVQRYAGQPEAVPQWVAELPWAREVNIRDYAGASDDERLKAAQQVLAARGGGVVFFPAGTYRFSDDILLENGVILRGETPEEKDAKSETYALRTLFEFPKYQPSMEGDGAPVAGAFKAIKVADARGTSNCGVVNIAINHGHIYFDEDEQGSTWRPSAEAAFPFIPNASAESRPGGNRLVFGCILRNTAAADPNIPNQAYFQQPHQRFTHRHRAAIHVYSGENMFIANNRIPKSGEDNFTVKPYVLIRAYMGTGMHFKMAKKTPRDEVVTLAEGVEFDYDNRPGIYANFLALGSWGTAPATPETYPWGFRKGTVIRDNYIYCSGRCAIAFTGDGVLCRGNVVRFPKGLSRTTTTGLVFADGSGTNDNRAVTARGYRWAIEDNDYEVYSNLAPGGQKINDGEGLMHEGFHNSVIRDARMVGNRGNQYLCLWAEVHGLLVERNTVSSDGNAIHLQSGLVEDAAILNNTVDRGPIAVSAGGAEGQIRGLRIQGNTIRQGTASKQGSAATPLALGVSAGKSCAEVRITGNTVQRGRIDCSCPAATGVTITGNRYVGEGTGQIVVTDPSWVGENENLKAEKYVPEVKAKKD